MRQMFEQEWPKHEKALFLVALSYLHDTEDAKDVLQEAAMTAYRKLDTLKNRDYFKTWLTRIVINKCKNFLKSKRCTEELTDTLNIFASTPGSDMEIMDAICRLESPLSTYISLRFYGGMSYEEMAKTLRQPVSTVKYRTKRALERLRNILEGDVDT